MVPWGAGHNLYKGLATLLLAFIGLQYLFGFVIETRPWEQLFANNATSENISVFTKNMSLQKEQSSNVTNDSVAHNTTSAKHNYSHSNLTLNSTQQSSESNQTEDEDVLNATTKGQQRPSIEFQFCPPIPPDLNGPVPIVKSPVPSVMQLEARFPWLQAGGRYSPDQCMPRNVVAIIVPYRSRAEHLLLFLAHMHPFLKKQQIDYTIYVVEQDGAGQFNRAMLMNVGFVEALKHRPYECFIFHDIDLLPEDDRNLYTCPEQPRHMSVAVDVFKYKLPYASIFGGVSALTRKQFQNLNGFSNSFWGWGGEDDDMSNRVQYHKYHISRYPANIARYTMLSHLKEKANPKRYDILSKGKNKYSTDGLNSLQYTLKQLRFNKLYTWLLVELHHSPS